MLSFLAPGYIIAAAAAAATLIAAHFIVRRQPRAFALPTARFVPDAPVLTTGWARVPADLTTLALRVSCVLLAGLALAGPYMQRSGGGTARVILVDRSRAVADERELRDSLAAIRRAGDVVIGYASIAAEAPPAERTWSGDVTSERGSLSGALVAGIRAASRFRGRADSVELVILSSFASEQLDAATARVRRGWPGRARLVRVSSAAQPLTVHAPVLASEPGDVFGVALDVARPAASAPIRIVRSELSAGDTAWLEDQAGRVLLHWPRAAPPAGFVARRPPETMHGVLGATATLVAPLRSNWQYVPAVDSKPVAWWIDGDVAASETRQARGCVRSVAIPVSSGGDFVLRPEFHALIRDLVQPCGGAPAYEPIPAASFAMLRGSGALAPAASFAQPRRDVSELAKWLLLAALACALLELVVRRRRGAPVSVANQDAAPRSARQAA